MSDLLTRDSPAREFSVWKTLRIGGMSADELIRAIEATGHKVGSWARQMMGRPAFTTEREIRVIDLVLFSVNDFGFPERATTREIWDRAIKEFGLELCPPSTGPHLRLAYGDQPEGECLWVAMDQITDSRDFPRVFNVSYVDDDRWLGGDHAPPDSRHPPHRLVLVLPRKAA